MRSLKGVMEHLENLHHAPIPFVEGLNIELLEFQRQSVQWALERETTPGGVQSFLWAKLPSVAEAGQDLYYSPILERFRRDKPQLVRGGIIAEEMGLGKTVISLALILQNPAPAVPQSGSPISALDALSNNTDVASAAAARTPWDTDLYSRTATSNSKRGSILSRGTLVVVRMEFMSCFCAVASCRLLSFILRLCILVSSVMSRSWDSGLTRQRKSYPIRVWCTLTTDKAASETPPLWPKTLSS